MTARWYRFAGDTRLSVAPTVGRTSVEVTWLLGIDALLGMDLSPGIVDRLQQCPSPFTGAQFDQAIGDRGSARLILGHLLRRGLVVRDSPRPRERLQASTAPLTRLVTTWPQPAGDYQLRSEPLHVPPGAVPLAYARAAITGQWCGFGISPDAAAADLIARCEALERFGMVRPDLTVPEPSRRGPRSSSMSVVAPTTSFETAPGVMFDYLREVAPSGVAAMPGGHGARRGHRQARTVMGHHAVGIIDNAWIYLGASPATNTNGAAFGSTLDAAIMAAQRELVERDVLLRAWYGLVDSRDVTRALAAQPTLRRWHHAALAVELQTRWFLLGGADGPFVTVACVIGAEAPPHLGFGCATRADLVGAAEKAFLEAAGSHRGHVTTAAKLGATRFMRAALKTPAAFHGSTFENYWPARVPHARSTITSRLSQSRIRRRHGLDARHWLWVDVTPGGLEHGHVVKVFHPDAVPLPNSMAQLQVLERLLGVEGDGTPPPIS